MAATLQIIGHKKSGKTLITTRLIQQLTAQGYQVAAIKHDAHHATMDTPHTDSARMSTAGANQVILQSEDEFFFHQQQQVPTLSQMVNFLATNNDIILIEGHKEAPYPKLLLLKPGENSRDVLTTAAPLQTGTIFKNAAATLTGQDQIVTWARDYLKEVINQWLA